MRRICAERTSFGTCKAVNTTEELPLGKSEATGWHRGGLQQVQVDVINGAVRIPPAAVIPSQGANYSLCHTRASTHVDAEEFTYQGR